MLVQVNTQLGDPSEANTSDQLDALAGSLDELVQGTKGQLD